MSHQPFETWILDHESLPIADRRTLQAHMETCQACQRLYRQWSGARQELNTRRMAAPASGFTSRWRASLAERRARAQRRQAWKIFGMLFAAALFIFLLLAGYVIATSSPTDWLIAVVQTFYTSSGLLTLGVLFVQTWLSNTPLAVNVVLWIYLTITFCLLSLAWVLVLWRTNIVGVFSK
jgi:predicted anti-sigma-YlaC factor YlaD